MTTTSFARLLSTASNPTLLRTGSEHLTRSVSNSVTRLLFSSSTQHPNPNAVRDQPQTPAPESLKQIQKEQEEEEEDDGDELDLNKETGEVGGPKGPEPTSGRVQRNTYAPRATATNSIRFGFSQDGPTTFATSSDAGASDHLIRGSWEIGHYVVNIASPNVT